MKVFIVLLAVFGVCLAAPKGATLREDIDDIRDLVTDQMDEDVVAAVLDFLSQDNEVIEFYEYLSGDEFTDVWVKTFALPELMDLINYLESEKINLKDVINQVADLLAKPHLPLSAKADLGGLRALVTKIEKILPIAEMRAMIREKVETSAPMKKLWTTISKLPACEWQQRARNDKSFMALKKRLVDAKLDIDGGIQILKDFFKWNC